MKRKTVFLLLNSVSIKLGNLLTSIVGEADTFSVKSQKPSQQRTCMILLLHIKSKALVFIMFKQSIRHILKTRPSANDTILLKRTFYNFPKCMHIFSKQVSKNVHLGIRKI